jgi:hypothetical protein
LTHKFPDILTKLDGSRAATSAEWLSDCRPTLASAVLREEYGAMPPQPRSLEVHTVRVDHKALDGRATLRELDVVTHSPHATLRLLVVTPNGINTPVPCFLGLNFRGNHQILDDPPVRPPASKDGEDVASERGRDAVSWPVAAILERGYGLATLFNGDAVPDNAELARQRLLDFVPAGMSPDAGDAPGTLACWAWSLSRALDALEREDAVDSQRVAFVGHSRNGKTALLATAMDPRPAVGIFSQSGCGGMGPGRDIGEEWATRETVAQICAGFPHWFCRNFTQYGPDPDLLPFEQNALVALCAPRPVLLSSASGDLWANPHGSFEMLQSADPVYRLLGTAGIETQPMSPVGTLVPSRLGHFLRAGGHSVTAEDWNAWLDYADIWLKASPKI